MTKPSKPRVRLKPVSDKQLEKRLAAGESFLRSSVRPTTSKIAHQRKPIKAKKRSAESAERIYGPKEFRAWIHEQRCAVCRFVGIVEQAHAKGDGIGRKASWRQTFPACGAHYEPRAVTQNGGIYELVEGCHRELHRIGVASFEAKHGVTLAALAARTHAEWLESQHPTRQRGRSA